ncbi:MAG: hypothetical protein ACI9AD_001595, partial [Nitriliruptoraceae bacterium]
HPGDDATVALRRARTAGQPDRDTRQAASPRAAGCVDTELARCGSCDRRVRGVHQPTGNAQRRYEQLAGHRRDRGADEPRLAAAAGLCPGVVTPRCGRALDQRWRQPSVVIHMDDPGRSVRQGIQLCYRWRRRHDRAATARRGAGASDGTRMAVATAVSYVRRAGPRCSRWLDARPALNAAAGPSRSDDRHRDRRTDQGIPRAWANAR